MAEFSKQYCATHNMGFKGDFDIMDEWIALAPGYITSRICEGYGFIAIGKLEEDLTQPWVYIPDAFDEGDGHWFTLDKI